MILKQYINENMVKKNYFDSIPDVEINKILHSKCKYYLSLIEDGMPLFRGMSSMSGNSGSKKVRQDRLSLGMEQDTADNLNKWLKQNGHTPRNKAVFAISKYNIASTFGNAYIIFPIGKFNYTWIESVDININDFKTGWETKSLELFTDYNNHTDKERNALLKYFNTNKWFYIAQNKGYEIWMDCKEYYYFNTLVYTWIKHNQKLYKQADTI